MLGHITGLTRPGAEHTLHDALTASLQQTAPCPCLQALIVWLTMPLGLSCQSIDKGPRLAQPASQRRRRVSEDSDASHILVADVRAKDLLRSTIRLKTLHGSL